MEQGQRDVKDLHVVAKSNECGPNSIGSGFSAELVIEDPPMTPSRKPYAT